MSPDPFPTAWVTPGQAVSWRVVGKPCETEAEMIAACKDRIGADADPSAVGALEREFTVTRDEVFRAMQDGRIAAWAVRINPSHPWFAGPPQSEPVTMVDLIGSTLTLAGTLERFGQYTHEDVRFRSAEILSLWRNESIEKADRLPKRTAGKRPDVRAAVEQAMRNALAAGQMTREDLNSIPKKALSARFGAGETTCYEVRKRVLATPTDCD